MVDYLLSRQDAPELERARLRLLEERNDPLTVAQLDAIGVGPGWRCLDVGAGAGSVSRMLADRVGDTGSVVAVDLDTTLLDELGDDRIEVRRHDLLAEPLPADAFDLVHARQLLMHLPARVTALRRLASAARPGGWIAAIDPDFSTVAVSPGGGAWERTWSAFLDVLVAGGWDPRYGARLAGDLRAAGLTDVHALHDADTGPGGSVAARLLSLSIERLRDRLLAFGAAGDEIDEARRALEDPATTVSPPTACVAWARRA